MRRFLLIAAACALCVSSSAVVDAKGFSSGGGFHSSSSFSSSRSFSSPSYTSSYRAAPAPSRFSSGNYTSSYRAPTSTFSGASGVGGYHPTVVYHTGPYYYGGRSYPSYSGGSQFWMWMYLMQPHYAAMGSPMYGQPGYSGYVMPPPSPLAIIVNAILFLIVLGLIIWAVRALFFSSKRYAYD